jgi:hypothetical protein
MFWKKWNDLFALGLSLSNILEMQTSTPNGRFFFFQHAATGYRYLRLQKFLIPSFKPE